MRVSPFRVLQQKQKHPLRLGSDLVFPRDLVAEGRGDILLPSFVLERRANVIGKEDQHPVVDRAVRLLETDEGLGGAGTDEGVVFSSKCATDRSFFLTNGSPPRPDRPSGATGATEWAAPFPEESAS